MSGARLVGKTAIVTGGARGIGRAICHLFAEHGASVAVVDINNHGAQETLKNLPRNHDNGHCAVEADVTNAEGARKSFEIAKEKLGKRCNLLVNNAGIIVDGFFGDSPESGFDDIMRVNLKGVYLMAKEFVTSLRDVEDEVRGSLINMSSIAGKIGYVRGAEYCASKFGVIGLTKTIALEFPRHRVRSNAVMPGLTATNMISEVKEEAVQAAIRAVPMKRIADPTEIAYACLFLASDESSFVNGACLEVTGGLGS